ncbi:two-component system response regulator [Leptospira perolatii]|uniref:Two-component system response regulator n=1 Tax=Leptospira perolatii TaxID=2023191 RepID=A0A2M9ZM29_9LEPT|nr:response regulator [Leptospira perolatii]PJZ69724.1 two-component system response regulator [Leptospira perolatii]PJZ73061.1 two-component system response regulator [Leptospira perolatii]
MQLNDVEILLVEDDPWDAELTIRTLKKYNTANKIHHVKDGVEALDFLFAEGNYSDRNVNSLPKVVLLDLNLPRINGPEVLQKLKSDDRTKSISVVVLTSSNDDSDLQKCYSLGANSYVIKPVEFDHFSKAVAELGFYWVLINKTPS